MLIPKTAAHDSGSAEPHRPHTHSSAQSVEGGVHDMYSHCQCIVNPNSATHTGN